MEQKDIEDLLKKYHAGECSAEQATFLESWYAQWNEKIPIKLSPEQLAEDLQIISNNVQPLQQEAKRVTLWPRIAAAASILLVLSAGGYFILHKDKAPEQVAQVQKVDVLPGNQSAVLQLSSGKQINLSTAKTGNIAQQGNTNITKTVDNKIIYQAGAPATELVYNTVTTKRGNFYPLTLSDGTIAILDAGSSIKYPVSFVGNERRVEITGQVYFEVTHNSKMPFKVIVKGQTIEDLGTHFNINAYDDEPNIKTTLIEGSVRINDQKTLTPGQQAVIVNGNIKIEKADVAQTIAWKNGLFNFDNMPVAEAMRQLSRWYDVKIEYPQGIPQNVIFSGGMHRNINASQVLDLLSFFKVHFQIVAGSGEKKILVKP
ncbi:FecR family protein [Mucilaginibacter sp. dw_454]|uniref:FecR family protein n=1 Tax=Mucilaginibacter sp. dw_454 TaxID=2720079 RepID=UPI001BD5C636|nr:FecR family protein [Mucilaginibacter sp. dw_454]